MFPFIGSVLAATSTAPEYVSALTTSLTDDLAVYIPYIIGVAAGIIGLFLGYRILKRFIGR